MAEDLVVSSRIIISDRYLRVTTSRSGGPGGQHVNTTDTKIHLFFDLRGFPDLHPSVKQRIRTARPKLISERGELQIVSDSYRSRLRNLEDARERLVALIRAHLLPPKKRKPTKPTRGSQRRRMDSKKKRGTLKKGRGRVDY